ncbi:MAG: hypothetical protein KDK70_43660, partial [Myxococcales bacterium]|nr:hypothetical protein [Myxococcales bacterium]
MRRASIHLVLVLVLISFGALACGPEPEPEPEPCEPAVFEDENGLADLGTNCGSVSLGSTVAEREVVRDCMLAADSAGEAAYAWADNGIDSTSRWIIYLRPGEEPPAWGVSYTSDPTYGGPGVPLEAVSAYPCTAI